MGCWSVQQMQLKCEPLISAGQTQLLLRLERETLSTVLSAPCSGCFLRGEKTLRRRAPPAARAPPIPHVDSPIFPD